MLDQALEQLESDSDARFVLDGQTVLLEDYLAVKPENETRIAALVRRGALEIGPWYILSDLLIPGAASLRRNLEEGTRDAERLGRRMDVLYSPDAFGHPAGLPALAAEFGIRWAVIRRGLGRPSGKDRDLYRWEAPNGKSVLVYHLPSSGYDVAIDLANAGDDFAERWAVLRKELVERAVSEQIAVFLGADHHLMVPNVSRLRERLQALEPLHLVRVSNLTEFFEAVERGTAEPLVLRGELRRANGHTWALQDVHSTRSRLKRRHSRVELTLTRIAEPLARLAMKRGGKDQEGLLRLAWRTLLQCQFHDTLAGTTTDAVQREQEQRLETVAAWCREIATRSLWELVKHDPDAARENSDRVRHTLVLWNPTERTRSGITTVALTFFRKDLLVGPPTGRKPRVGLGYQAFALEGPFGAIIPVQVLAVRRDRERLDAMRHYPDQAEVDRVWVAFRAPEAPSLGVSTLTPRVMRRPPRAAGLEVGDGYLSNPFVTLRVSRTGVLELVDRRTGERYPGLCALEDEPEAGDTYTHSRGRGRVVSGGRPESRTVLARGPLLGALETRWTMRTAGQGQLRVRQVVVLHADSPLVRLRLDIGNYAIQHRLRARFPVGVLGTPLAGGAFGPERRPPVTGARPHQAPEQEVSTAPAHRFVALARGPGGLALFAPGFFEYECFQKGALLVSLLRSVGELTRGALPERPGHAGWPEATPAAQEPGMHMVELAIASIEEADLDPPHGLERAWEDAFLPTQAVFLRDFTRL